MKKIIAIGGGEIGRPGYPVETTKIDIEIIKGTGKKNPKLLFIPTASSDSELYSRTIRKHFGNKLGCKVDVLNLIKENLKYKEIKDKILTTDIIYVGGGNTLKMMRLWRSLGVDKLLKTAWKNGIILCGLSAGSICWFESGHSDSLSFYNPKKWEYINVRGLELLRGIHCPHYDSHTLNIPRKKYFQKMISKIGGIGIAIDNNCAIEFFDDKYRVITSKKDAKAFRVFRKKGKIYSEIIPQEKEFKPTKDLFNKN